MKKFICSVIAAVLAFSLTACGKEYIVQNEKDAVAVYTCASDNMFGLEKIVVFEDKIVTVFNKSVNDASDYGTCTREMKTDNSYGNSAHLSNLLKYKTIESNIKEKQGKYISTVMFEYDAADILDSDRGVDVTGVSVGYQEIAFNAEGINLYYVIWGGECSDDYSQSYDFSTKKWSEIHDKLTFYPMTDGYDENTPETLTDTDDSYIPSKDDVLSMREIALEGMTEDEIQRLTENIKIANIQMESGYLNDNLFGKLSDPDSPYWLYFDQTGEFQIGWWYNGTICSKETIMRKENISEEVFYETYTEPGTVYNRFDADNFIELIEDMQSTVHNERLSADLQRLINLTQLAKETHEMEYANEIYKILHDLDYFLLRYGIEDVGQYTQDKGVVSTYYGVLNIYKQE